MNKSIKTIYFIAGIASLKQRQLALKANASIYNSQAFGETDYVDTCDFVMGDVPEAYSKFEKHTLHETAMKLVAAKEKEAADKTKKESADEK